MGTVVQSHGVLLVMRRGRRMAAPCHAVCQVRACSISRTL
ncbi:uncharacterized protein AruCF_1735 [Achromobacter ruhlandii]|nr:uncharacterized protein AruCF_1735 [Achromobacter ruhlandii]